MHLKGRFARVGATPTHPRSATIVGAYPVRSYIRVRCHPIVAPPYGPPHSIERTIAEARHCSYSKARDSTEVDNTTTALRKSALQLSAAELEWARRHPLHPTVMDEERIVCLQCGRRLLSLK